MMIVIYMMIIENGCVICLIASDIKKWKTRKGLSINDILNVLRMLIPKSKKRIECPYCRNEGACFDDVYSFSM